MAHLLLIEDDDETAEEVAGYFGRHGYQRPRRYLAGSRLYHVDNDARKGMS